MPRNVVGFDFLTEKWGYTDFYSLEGPKVKFEKEIDAVVQLTIEREAGKLMDSELKLTALQVRGGA